MDIFSLNSFFSVLGIIAAVITVISMLGVWYTGNQISQLKDKEITVLKQDVERNKETYFTHNPKTDYSVEELNDGKFKLSFRLHPVGQKQVPRLTIKITLDSQTRFTKFPPFPVILTNFAGSGMTGSEINAHYYEAYYDNINPKIQVVTALVDRIPTSAVIDWSAKEP